ncbi:MAG TPA: transferrin receptor-like dimerization domain-containing protein [Vicinamibacterales bacterium]|jgi:N-acetylated-alpha-linked acidic dipeptidase|nr:transferrin receptor-like dimerization domain-containing protein [Vicinamibacterales bacterium]
MAPRKGAVSLFAVLASLAAAGWLSAQSTTPSVARIRGFSAAASAAQAARENTLKAMPSAKAAEADFDVMTAEPHHTGSPYEIKLADYVSDQFKQIGIESTKYEYSVLLPWPKQRRIDIVAPDQLRLEVEEEKIRGDQWADKPGILPAYNAYSPSGDVTGEIVYVNFGIPADYETLDKLGISVKGRIVLARYGGSWRGIKPKVAAEHGAIACIIYSDPHEDGYFQGDVYPDGPYRGWGMIQRGSVMDMPRYPGDPSTPDRPSKAGVERLPMDKIETFAPIPVQPMSYRDGVELLKRLKGPVAPPEWRGALPITYRIGPGPARVHMNLQMDYGQRRLINVVGKITGSVAPDEWVIVGSHRDAWTFGASDSVSGHVSMMAVARAMSAMMKTGWKPRRSVLFISWDGEEQGLLGSTEFVEDLTAELKAKTAVYVNRDAGAGGLNFSSSAVHSLTPFVHELAQSIQPQGATRNLYEGWLERAREQAPARDGRPLLKSPPVGALGSGSDYTAFLDHAGIASMDMGLNGPGGDGSYHSTYDNPTWFKKYIDPQFTFSVLAAQVTGVALLRLADAEVLPFDYEAYGRQILEYIDEIEQQASKASADGAKKVDFAGLRSAANAFARAGAGARDRGDSLLASASTPQDLAALNHRLIMAERDLIEPAGLPDRPWYRHVIYAPGLYTGYGVKTIPGVREAVDAGNYTRAAEQAAIVIRALQRATRTLEGS